ncbi:uncharacterized protein NPIL_273111 [Nephila pilipes]|uniref:Uncharacterized protein n=1 Tax=Nephila pilipes TaxID=299642 RepID=A0A8X6PTW4_NEPPI|nr:uncharacterized protein NPIL_273111 [Nephila pilipes]
MDNNRAVPKTRPRPYDLRRKVLLKNFMREQMIYISEARRSATTSLAVNNETNFDDDLSNSVGNEENILTPKKVQDNIVSSTSAPEPTPSTSTFSEKENSNNFDSGSSNHPLVSNETSETNSRPSTRFPRLSNLLGMREKRKMGIKKAKHDFKTLKGINKKPLLNGISNKIKMGERPFKEKRKSFFSLFKSRREKKRNKISTVEKINIDGTQNTNNSESQVSRTSTQSVQTDISWSGIRDIIEQTVVSVISKTDLTISSGENSYRKDFCSNTNNLEFSNSKEKPFYTHENANHSQRTENSRRVLRSKSMQERCEKRHQASSCLRTRSMNRGYYNRSLDTSPYSTKKTLRFPSIEFEDHLTFSRAKTKSINVPNSRRILPMTKANNSSVLMTLPNNNSSKVIVRRSSMPERTSRWANKSYRPMRSNSVRENRNLQVSQQLPYRRKQSSSSTISSGRDGYACPLSLQDLPAEAFY